MNPSAFVLVQSAPMVLVYLVGLLMALAKFPVHPRTCAFALTGFVALLLGRVVSGGVMLVALPQYRGHISVAEIGLWTLLSGFLTFMGMIFILSAIFAERESRQLADGALARGLKKRDAANAAQFVPSMARLGCDPRVAFL